MYLCAQIFCMRMCGVHEYVRIWERMGVKKNTMKSEDIIALFERFEQAATRIKDVECWSAREICPLLGYTQWRNFLTAIEKAKDSCVNAGEQISDHFVDVSKMVEIGSGTTR